VAAQPQKDLNLKRFLPPVALVLTLLVPSGVGAYAQTAPPTPPPAASVYTSDTHPECTIVPVPGVDGVFTVDITYVLGVQQPGANSTGGPQCGPAVWTPAIVFLRGLSNAGVGLSLKDQYLQGTNMPQYVLVAAEACGDDRGFNCGFFSVLVPGQRSGEHWNAATAAAHNLQKSKPPTNLGPRAASGTWDFMGEEPQPVSDACLKALPLDPCWGNGYVDYTLPAASSPAPTPSAPAPTPSAPTPADAGAASVPNISGFVGVWWAHKERLEVHADGSASLAFFPVTAPNAELTLQFTSATPTVATLEVVASDSPDDHSVGETWTLTLNDNDTLTPRIDGVDGVGLDLCGPQAPAGWCGA